MGGCIENSKVFLLAWEDYIIIVFLKKLFMLKIIYTKIQAF